MNWWSAVLVCISIFFCVCFGRFSPSVVNLQAVLLAAFPSKKDRN